MESATHEAKPLRYFTNEKGTGTPQWLLGSLLATRRSAIGQFVSLSLVTVPLVFSQVNST